MELYKEYDGIMCVMCSMQVGQIRQPAHADGEIVLAVATQAVPYGSPSGGRGKTGAKSKCAGAGFLASHRQHRMPEGLSSANSTTTLLYSHMHIPCCHVQNAAAATVSTRQVLSTRCPLDHLQHRLQKPLLCHQSSPKQQSCQRRACCSQPAMPCRSVTWAAATSWCWLAQAQAM